MKKLLIALTVIVMLTVPAFAQVIDYKVKDQILNNVQVLAGKLRQLYQQHQNGKGRVVDVDIAYTASQKKSIKDRATELEIELIAEVAKL